MFTIKYLRSLCYKVENDMFKDHSWYFRNALVRANYRNAVKGVEPTEEYLIIFFRNFILGEKHELKNRYLHIRWDSSKPQNEVSGPELSVKEKAVVDVMAGSASVSIDEIAKITGIPDSTLDRIIRSLKDKGVIERRGRKNNSVWVVKI